MTDTVVAEGQVKFRDGKKWKTRWVVVRKPSPVADCLSVSVYKERKRKGKEKDSGHKERLSVTLESICGVEPGPGYDGVCYTLSILCLAHTLVLGFHSRDALQAWNARLRFSLGEAHHFSVNVEPGTKLESGAASLHLCNNLLSLTKGLPPLVVGHWKLSALRRYGAVPNGFVFEGGTRCGYWAGVFFLSCSDGEQISFLFDCIVRGINPSSVPGSLRPALPAADPRADAASVEERISQEASELEKRLSMLSRCSLASSSAYSYSCSTSVAGDDRSSISSSSSSQSDASYGGRLPFWAEPLAKLHLSNETASSSCTIKALTRSDDGLYATTPGGGTSGQLHHRRLHDSGRQSSLDSGIGIATGSQSSYSGSFSSCTGSLDMASQGGGEEFGSLASLPVHPSAPPPTPPPLQALFIPEPSSATSSSRSFASRSDSRGSQRSSDEYQMHDLLKLRYDTPRSLLHNPRQPDPPGPGGPAEFCRVGRVGGEGVASQLQRSTNTGAQPWSQEKAAMQLSQSSSSERTHPVDSEGTSTARPPPAPASLSCGETQWPHSSDNYITPEQWWSTRNRCQIQVGASSSGPLPSADPPETPFCVSEELRVSRDACLERALALTPPSSPPPPPPVPPGLPRPDSACALPPESVCHVGSAANYVNIPGSPLPAGTCRELLRAQEPETSGRLEAVREHPAQPEEGSSRYTHLNVGAMETAQRVGAECIQGREGALTQHKSRPPH